MDIESLLTELGLTKNNSIVIGSGILQALDIRDSRDIDVVTDKQNFNRLKATGEFQKISKYGQDTLIKGVFEVTRGWEVLGGGWAAWPNYTRTQ